MEMKTGQPTRTSIEPQASAIVNYSWEKWWLKFRVLVQMLDVAQKKLGGVRPAFAALRSMRRQYRQIFGEVLILKVAKTDGRYYRRLGSTGFSSGASRRMHENEVNHIHPSG